jgi:Ca2+/H+ antiporter
MIFGATLAFFVLFAAIFTTFTSFSRFCQNTSRGSYQFLLLANLHITSFVTPAAEVLLYGFELLLDLRAHRQRVLSEAVMVLNNKQLRQLKQLSGEHIS